MRAVIQQNDTRAMKIGQGHHNKARLTFSALGLMLAAAMCGLSGCALVGIPSQRYADGDCSNSCASGPLPPLPGRLAAWQAEKELPVAPDYPRFHPLPTKPMFTPKAEEFPHQ